jgi:hypothetical protein
MARDDMRSAGSDRQSVTALWWAAVLFLVFSVGLLLNDVLTAMGESGASSLATGGQEQEQPGGRADTTAVRRQGNEAATHGGGGGGGGIASVSSDTPTAVLAEFTRANGERVGMALLAVRAGERAMTRALLAAAGLPAASDNAVGGDTLRGMKIQLTAQGGREGAEVNNIADAVARAVAQGIDKSSVVIEDTLPPPPPPPPSSPCPTRATLSADRVALALADAGPAYKRGTPTEPKLPRVVIGTVASGR